MWQCTGNVIFNGITTIGSGSRLSINKDAILTFGSQFCMTGGSTIICSKEISFGNECLISWDVLIMDTDFHHIISRNNEKLNPPNPIHIGNHVWIGCRNTILKGVVISDDMILAAGSKITKDILSNHSIVGGTDKLRIIKEDISWNK